MSTRDTLWPVGSPAWIDLGTDDLRTTRQTYGHLLGWDMDDGTSSSGGYVVALKHGRAAAGAYLAEDGQPPAWLVYFASEDVDATTAQAIETGASVVMEPTGTSPTIGRFAVLQDPTGATFGVWQGEELSGLQVLREPGAFCWTTLLTRDLPAAREFYATVFGYAYDEVDENLVTVRTAEGEAVASMHHAEQLPDDAPAAWNVHFCVASRDATVALAEMEEGLEVLMSFDSPFGPEAVLRTSAGEVFNVTETPD